MTHIVQDGAVFAGWRKERYDFVNFSYPLTYFTRFGEREFKFVLFASRLGNRVLDLAVQRKITDCAVAELVFDGECVFCKACETIIPLPTVTLKYDTHWASFEQFFQKIRPQVRDLDELEALVVVKQMFCHVTELFDENNAFVGASEVV